MFPALLSAVVLALVQDPTEVAAPPAALTQPVSAAIEVGDSWFVVENHSEYELLLFVSSVETGVVTVERLPPFVQQAWPYPQDATSHLFVELLLLHPEGWRNSGAFSLAQLRALELGTAWVTDEACTLILWEQIGTGVAELQPSGEILPEPVLDAGMQTLVDYSVEADMSSPVHVPIIVPGGGIPPGTPPPITEKPLPPV